MQLPINLTLHNMHVVYRFRRTTNYWFKNSAFSPFTPTPVSFETVAGKGLLL